MQPVETVYVSIYYMVMDRPHGRKAGDIIFALHLLLLVKHLVTLRLNVKIDLRGNQKTSKLGDAQNSGTQSYSTRFVYNTKLIGTQSEISVTKEKAIYCLATNFHQLSQAKFK